MERAITLDEIISVLSPRPIVERTELELFFVETADARDANLGRRFEIAQHLRSSETTKIMLAGHSGSGKSTELARFAQEHAHTYCTVRVSVLEEAILAKLTVEPLLVLIAEGVLLEASERGLSLDNDLLDGVYAWFDDVLVEDTKGRKATASVGAGIDSGASPLVGILGLFARVRADIEMGVTTLERVVRRDERKIVELIRHCNALIAAVRCGLEKKFGLELLVVIEDLDKCSLKDANTLFIHDPAPLTGLKCKAIYTAPIFLLNSPTSSALTNGFVTVRLPMIKTHNRNGSKCEAGIATIRRIIDARMDCSTLIEPEALNLAIEKSGGVLRLLFDVITTASISALQANTDSSGSQTSLPIQVSHVQYGLNRKKTELLNKISTLMLPSEFGSITQHNIEERITELLSNRKRVPADPINLMLMEAQALIEYNGEGWHALHPLVADEYTPKDEG